MRFVLGCIRCTSGVLIGLAITACGPKYPNCENDNDCRTAEVCVNSRCQQCRVDSDCSTDQKCASGACVAMDYCDSAADCADGQVCKNNLCASCTSDEDCGNGKACLDGMCKTPECTSDEECPAGLSCVDKQCRNTESSDATAWNASDGCTIDSVYFSFDSSLLRSEARNTLKADYECMKSEDGKIIVEGHADPRGTTEYNMALGERRSRSVKNYLTKNGADPQRLRVRSKGEEEATGYNEPTWAKDRRVDFD